MKQSLFREKYPIFSLEVEKIETSFKAIDEIIAYLKKQIEAHALARFIAVFDHCEHTRSLAEGQVGEDILAAKSLVFCFGITLPNPQAMALRPRSIGVVEIERGFVVTFMEAPMPVANSAMEDWVKAISDREPTVTAT